MLIVFWSWQYDDNVLGINEQRAGSSIVVCCDGMKTMIEDGTIQPFTAFGHETAQMYVRGKNRELRHYNLIKYCPFCGKPIKIRH
jgi:hypothetical protein